MTSNSITPPSGVPRRPRFWIELSLERKIPLLMTLLLATMLAASILVTCVTLMRSSEAAARERLRSAAGEIAGTIRASTLERARKLHAAAADPAIREALASAPVDKAGSASLHSPSDVADRPVRSAARDSARLDAARSALSRLSLPSDSVVQIELWTADGFRVAFVGSSDTAPSNHRGAGPVDDETRHPVAQTGLDEARASDSASFGALYGAGGRVYFWVTVPVFDGKRVIGHVAQKRRLGGPARAVQSLRDLTGEHVAMYLRNTRGSFWAEPPSRLAAVPAQRDSGSAGLVHTRPGVGRILATEVVVVGTPWTMVLEAPVDAIRTRWNGTLLRLSLLSALLTALGAVLSWMLSRRLTRPLTTLSRMAGAIARGEYKRRVDDGRGDEIGRLAGSFNQMARQVDASRQELERRVTAAQDAAAELERTNTKLQDAMVGAAQAQHEAERATTDAERANRAKSDFLAVMSHELRTPLNAIGGYAQLLELEVHGPINDAQRDALVRIGRSQSHLLRLINDVLHFARIDAGQAHYTIGDVQLDDALSGLEPLVAPQVRSRRLVFTYRPCDPQLTVRADRDKLEQIVLNLLTNAIKFTPEGGHVAVSCDATDDDVRISVQDTGVGIPAERLPAVFDPFVQVDRALHRPNDGVGLGLSISRDLARGMGGDLAVESEVGQGSRFTLTLARCAVRRVAIPMAVETSGN